jgi:hypothetical protein
LPPDDGLAKFPLSKKKSGYGQEVQLRKKDRQRGYEKVWDMVLRNIETLENNWNF